MPFCLIISILSATAFWRWCSSPCCYLVLELMRCSTFRLLSQATHELLQVFVVVDCLFKLLLRYCKDMAEGTY